MDFLTIIEKHGKTIMGAFIGLVVIGALAMFMVSRGTQGEKLAQERYFIIEKKLAEAFAKKANPQEKVDFSAVKTELQAFIDQNPKTVAAQMAAINLAKILKEENLVDDALAVLKKTEDYSNAGNISQNLIQSLMASILAEKNDCATAITVWQKIIDNKKAEFLHDNSKLQQAICYSKTNDIKKAEELLTNLANQTANPEMQNSSASKEAEKYLRLLQAKKISGT